MNIGNHVSWKIGLILKVSFVSKPKYLKLQTENRKLLNNSAFNPLLIKILAHVKNISDQNFKLYANY
ncbi:hypothetical protein T07_6030 [Trichinella nelsoni]|uniref:Uncharacterized protein n=1 Tax=Trichinella nelsoni TaxID=6336 RepID=A0A0V0SGE2_9BILA|nr:hypothetical protein T07_6030 [Trichinella nelsoni]